MKIGILTYHRAENYGALLQAYATMTYLRSLGHEVSFVDYWPKYHSDYFCLFSLQIFKNRNIKGKIALLLRLAIWGIPRYIRRRRLQEFMQEHLELPQHPKYTGDACRTEEYDVVVYGSDQIWRKQNLGGVRFDDWYFGTDQVQSKKKIAYAGSMGAVDFDGEDESYVIQLMKNFDALSVREKDLHDYLSSKGIESQLVCDPVFLLSKDEWQKIATPSHTKKKYILFYNLLGSQESVCFANQLSKKTGLPVVEINKVLTPSHFLSRRYVSCASVDHFLGLIRDAEYVVSNSFHGVAFSIIFEKKFFAIGMRERANRVLSLLDIVRLTNRYIYNISNDVDFKARIIYNSVNERIRPMICQSKSFLNKSVEVCD